jgi:hypothetical protein
MDTHNENRNPTSEASCEGTPQFGDEIALKEEGLTINDGTPQDWMGIHEAEWQSQPE